MGNTHTHATIHTMSRGTRTSGRTKTCVGCLFSGRQRARAAAVTSLSLSPHPAPEKICILALLFSEKKKKEVPCKFAPVRVWPCVFIPYLILTTTAATTDQKQPFVCSLAALIIRAVAILHLQLQSMHIKLRTARPRDAPIARPHNYSHGALLPRKDGLTRERERWEV